MASFRTPPTLSRNLAIGTIAAVCRGVGLGHWFLTKAFARAISQKKRASMFAGYEPTERDVFVVTYPKSGTNWAMQIAVQTAWLGRAEFEHIYDLVAWPEGPFAGITPLRDLGPAERAPTGKRVIRSSLPAAFVPYSDKAAYIVVMRDPKEVMVSSYYFMLGLFGLLDHISLEQWLELFTSESFPAGPWAAHTHSYWSMLDRPNVLILHFAEMRKNLPGTVELVAELMGVPLDEEQLTAVVERSSFAYMKQHDAAFGPPRLPLCRERTALVRSGKSGASGELLSRAQQAAIDRYCIEGLEALGSDYPYHELYEVVEAP